MEGSTITPPPFPRRRQRAAPPVLFGCWGFFQQHPDAQWHLLKARARVTGVGGGSGTHPTGSRPFGVPCFVVGYVVSYFLKRL